MKRLYDRATALAETVPDIWRENVELVELNRRFLWFLLLRLGVAAALVVVGAAKGLPLPHLSFDASDCFPLAAVLALENAACWLHYRRVLRGDDFRTAIRRIAHNVQAQIVLDFLVLGFLAYATGGLESPLVFFFLFHNMLSCLFFRRTVSFLHTLLSVAIIALLYWLPSAGLVPVRHLLDPSFAPVAAPRPFALTYLAGVIAVYLISWYLVSTITKSLKFQEARLQQKVQEMIDLTRERARYMLVTTHELKAPFAAIQSYVNVALGGYAGEVPPRLEEILRKIGARCDTLSRMITEMIQLANISSLKERRGEVAFAPLDLAGAIGAAVGRFAEMAAAKGVSFEVEPTTGPVFVAADAQQLEILLNNLLRNAVTYCYPQTVIRIAFRRQGEKILATVHDAGIGIKPEHLEKVFLGHFRSERAAEMNPNSTGLGLTTAREIMDIHGGRIWIESVEGQETTVFLEFPAPPPSKGAL